KFIMQSHVRINQNIAHEVVVDARLSIDLDSSVECEFNGSTMRAIPIDHFFFFQHPTIIFNVHFNQSRKRLTHISGLGHNPCSSGTRELRPGGRGRYSEPLVSTGAAPPPKDR